MVFFREPEADSPADFVLVCQTVKPLAVHSAAQVLQVGSPKHRADYRAAHRADWQRPRVGCDFQNLCLRPKLVSPSGSVLVKGLA